MQILTSLEHPPHSRWSQCSFSSVNISCIIKVSAVDPQLLGKLPTFLSVWGWGDSRWGGGRVLIKIKAEERPRWMKG